MSGIKRFLRVRHFMRCFRYWISDSTVIKNKSAFVPRTLLLVRIEAIGDYFTFRNFLQVLRASDQFRGYRITLCGNILWKDIAETFDSRFVDDFIWIDRRKLAHNAGYRKQTFAAINHRGFEMAIQ